MKFNQTYHHVFHPQHTGNLMFAVLGVQLENGTKPAGVERQHYMVHS